MTELREEDDRLAALLRAIPLPEPPPDFVGSARRRYVEALEHRYRREALMSLVACALGFGIAASIVLSVFEPVSLLAWSAVAAAELAAWMKGMAIVLSALPPVLWAPALLGLMTLVLPFVLLARAPSALAVK